MNIENNNELTKLAAQSDPMFTFKGPTEITGINGQHADWFNRSIENVAGFTPVAGPAITGGLAVAMATGSPLLGGLAATGIAVHTTFKGSGPKGRS